MAAKRERMWWAGALAVAIALAGAGYFRGAVGAPPPPAPREILATSTQLPPPTAKEMTEARAVGRTFAAVAAQVSPSVVRISVAKSPRHLHTKRRHRESPFDRFFDDGEGNEEDSDDAPRMRGVGSGIVIDGHGHILTNNHVVEDADEVKVTFVGGKSLDGKVVGTDPKSDLALVKVEGSDAPAARLGDSDRMQVGEWVLAIGNPFGLDHTVTVGVLSAKNRGGFESGQYEDFLQTDASINPGNSGGPLINVEGEVVGINTMIAGIGTRIGFAVPSSMAVPVVEQLVRGGKVVRPYLGIDLQDVTPDLQRTLGPKAPESGALVGEVKPGSPASRAGVKAGDVIIGVGGAKVTNAREAQRAVLRTKVGQHVSLDLWRDGKTLQLTANTVELPSSEAEERAPEERSRGQIGLALRTLTPPLAEQLGVGAGARGAVVVDVRRGSAGEEAGLRPGDVIVEIDRAAIGSAADATRALGTARATGHLVRVRRSEGSLYVVIPAPK